MRFNDRHLTGLILRLDFLSRCNFFGALLILLWQKILRYRLLMLDCLFENDSGILMRLYELGVFKTLRYSF